MNAAVVKRTQEALGKVIRRPPLTEKLLSKPPFRYLHDIITEVGAWPGAGGGPRVSDPGGGRDPGAGRGACRGLGLWCWSGAGCGSGPGAGQASGPRAGVRAGSRGPSAGRSRGPRCGSGPRCGRGGGRAGPGWASGAGVRAHVRGAGCGPSRRSGPQVPAGSQGPGSGQGPGTGCRPGRDQGWCQSRTSHSLAQPLPAEPGLRPCQSSAPLGPVLRCLCTEFLALTPALPFSPLLLGRLFRPLREHSFFPDYP